MLRISLVGLVLDVAENVIEDKVSVGLAGKDEGLNEFTMWLRVVGKLADDLDDNVGVGGLRVDISDTDLGVFVFELSNALFDSLAES